MGLSGVVVSKIHTYVKVFLPTQKMFLSQKEVGI